MSESKNISDYDIILLPYIAEIIASDKLTDDQRELQLSAIFKLRSILKYYANRRYLSKLINAIAEKKGAMILKITSKTEMKLVLQPDCPRYDGNRFIKAPKKLVDITLDSVIMAPDMIKSLTEKTDGRKITIYSLEEDWAYDDDYGHTTEIFLDYMLAKKKLCEKIKNEKEDGSVERWLDDDELIEDYGNDYYEAYLDGYYSSSHYLVDITSHSVSVNDSVVSDFANAYISKSRVEDFVSQIEQWDEVEKMTDKQYNAMITDKDLPDRIRTALSKNDTYWEAYWQSISELAFRMVEEYSKKQFSEENKNNAIS